MLLTMRNDIRTASHLAEVLGEGAVVKVYITEGTAGAHRALVAELGGEQVVECNRVRAEVATAPYERQRESRG